MRFFQSDTAALMASSASTEQWIFTGGRFSSSTICVLRIAKELSLPPVKIHCSVLAEDAIKAAIADFKKKRAERQDGAAKATTTG